MKKYNSEFKLMIIELYNTECKFLKLSLGYDVSEVTMYKCIKQISTITSIDDTNLTLEEVNSMQQGRLCL